MNRSLREGKNVKRFERSNGLDTALYKNYLFLPAIFRFVHRPKEETLVLTFPEKQEDNVPFITFSNQQWRYYITIIITDLSQTHINASWLHHTCTNFPVKQGCDSAPVSDLINADEGDLYRPNPALHVEYVRRGRYRMFNNSDAHLPFIWFEVPAEQSVLRPFYNETTVKDDASLKVELARGRKQWLLKLKAEMVKCPGET